MALIDLPPEPSLPASVLAPKVSISTDTQYSDDSREPVHHFLTNYTRDSSSPFRDWVEVAQPATSLIPAEQLTSWQDDNAFHPAIAQLPPLPPETDSDPIQPETDASNITENEEETATSEGSDTVEQPTVEPEAAATPSESSEETDSLGDTDATDNSLTPSADTEASTPPTPDNANPAAAVAPAPSEPLDPTRLEITADTQEFDAGRQVVIARGNVVFKLDNAFLLADELWVNLVNRYALAEGNVILTRGEQEVRGERAEYNLFQEEGTIFETRGELFLPRLEDDLASPLEGPVTSRSVFDPLNPDEDVSNVTTTGSLQISSQVSPSLPETEGNVQRLRFEAARVYFDAESWIAEEVRLTNDPFSPPELEFRTNRMTLTTFSPTADLLTTENPRLVFDQGFTLPLLQSRYILNRGAVDSNQVNPFIVGIGSDSRDRGGVFIESEIPIVRNEATSFSLTPQYFVERALDQGATDPEVFGLEADFRTRFSPRSDLSVRAALTGFDTDELENNLRGSIRNRYIIGNHLLAAEYSYRDRLFNGSLGFQDVRSSLGAVLISPPINLDGRGLILTYQAGGQLITARTDRQDLVDGPLGDEDLVTLGRFQGTARLSKGFNLWRGKPLPATQHEGLRYTPSPIVPFLNLNVSILGVGSYYTSGDFQEVLGGDVRLGGQVGHLSDNFFDYTRFNIGYYREIVSNDSSPFLFDRNVDDNVLSFGIVQQIIGPILLGFQTSINIDTSETINTEIIAEYSRRTYGLVFRYSPTKSTGSIGFRLSDFNWLGSGSPFDDPNIREVESGIVDQR